jgi:hypothetical protein
MKGCFFFLSAAAVAATDSMIQVALAPPESNEAAAAFEHFTKAEAGMEASGLGAIQKAMNIALGSAKAEIDAAIHGSSFLRGPSEVYVRVLGGPASQSMGRASQFEGVRSDIEGKRIAQAAAEFDALTKIIVGELKRALHTSFLKAGSDALNVKVKASAIPWPSTVDLLQHTEMGRDASEAAFEGKVLDLQIKFCKALNQMIANSLRG